MFEGIAKFLRGLFQKNKLPKLSELPDSFYVGQDYVEDKVRIPTEIQLYFPFSADIENTTLNIENKEIKLEQRGDILRVVFIESISEKLFQDISKNHTGDDWILGYVSEVLPYVNQEILRQRYRQSHFLLKTLTALDISQLWLVNVTTKQKVQIAWPKAIANFPPAAELAKNYDDKIYLRDIIDAIHSFFNSNYEESIRKIITSVETFIKSYNLKVQKKTYKTDFEETVRQHMNITCPMTNENAADVIMDTYKTRNEIVHDGKRLNPKEGKKISKRGIHLILDVYKNHGTDEDQKRYAFFLEEQFMFHEQFLGDSLTLKWLEKSELKKKS